MACSEYYDFKIFGKCSQNFPSEGPHVDSDLNDLASGKIYFNFEITRHVHILIAVNQSFVKIENYCLFVLIAICPRQIHSHMLNAFFLRNFGIMEHSQILN